MTTVAFGADHAGYDLKQHLIEKLSAAGYDIIDHGTHSTESVDYPEFCAAAARSVRDGAADVGIVLGGSGQGEQLAANKVNRDRFVREARAAAALDSDHIVPILHIGETPDGAPFIVMPYLQGKMLETRLRREPVAPVAPVGPVGQDRGFVAQKKWSARSAVRAAHET